MPRTLDAIDLEILRILARDCKATIKDLSAQVGVSPPVVRKRIRRMKSWGLIKGCTPLLDPEVLGATSYIIVFEFRGHQSIRKVFESNPEIEKVYLSTPKRLGVMVVRVLDVKRLDTISRKLEDSGAKVVSTAIVDDESLERTWLPERPLETVQPKCAFCGSPIIGRPYKVTLEDGTILLFNSEDCAEAYFTLRARKRTNK